jgi:hypothetical protein
MRSRSLPWLVSLAVASACASCAPRRLSYLVAEPPSAPEGPRVVAAALTSDRGRVAVVLDWPSPEGAREGARVEAAWLAPAGGAPCEGRPAAEIAIDDTTSWARPIAVAGGQAVELSFPVPARMGDDVVAPPAPANVDLRVVSPGEAARCVRVPLPALTSWRRAGPWSWGGRVALEAPEIPASSVVARVGRWWGPLRLGAELGVSVRPCNACLSALYLGLPVALTAEVTRALRWGAALGVEVAYTARPLRGVGDGDRYLLLGPRVTLRLGAAAPRDDGLPGGPSVRLSALDVWWARVTAAGVENWSQTLFGVGWTWDEGL